MKTIIAGSRYGIVFKDVESAVISCPWELTSVVSGGAIGVDQIGEHIADCLSIPKHIYPITSEDWQLYKNAAGPIRNRRMAENAEALIAVWDGKSSGTKDMIQTARKLGLFIHIHVVGKNYLEMFD